MEANSRFRKFVCFQPVMGIPMSRYFSVCGILWVCFVTFHCYIEFSGLSDSGHFALPGDSRQR